MKFKPIPEPPADLETVAELLEAIPETAGAVDDCCARLVDETGLEARGEAETWLVFLRALELATAEPDGYRRAAERSPSDLADALESADARVLSRLRRAFRDRVHAADAVLEALEEAPEPRTADAVFDSVREESPAFERGTSDGRRAAHRERVRRLLEWAVSLGLAERTPDGGRYRPANGSA